jgi:hypothetical protein
MSDKKKRIFSGVESKTMWSFINNAKSIPDIREALYLVCCKLQEFEGEIESQIEEEKRRKWKDLDIKTALDMLEVFKTSVNNLVILDNVITPEGRVLVKGGAIHDLKKRAHERRLKKEG